MSEFYYEHIGHMQCAEITLVVLNNLYALSKGDISKPVEISKLVEKTRMSGFSDKIINSEIDRFFYGGIARNLFDGNCVLTYIGLDYYTQLIKEVSYQKNVIALLVRRSKRKGMYNITLQETTFFNKETYDVIAKYSLRSGGARDFIKSVDLAILNNLVLDLSKTIYGEELYAENFDDVNQLVKKYGKYWVSVGGKYSWIIFSQRYKVNVNMEKYKNLVLAMKRPTEWGFGNDLSHKEIIDILGSEKEINNFINNLIIRKLSNGWYRMTSPGYLIFERINKGYILEFEIQKSYNNQYLMLVCSAKDNKNEKLFSSLENSTLMKLHKKGDINQINYAINQVLTGKGFAL